MRATGFPRVVARTTQVHRVLPLEIHVSAGHFQGLEQASCLEVVDLLDDACVGRGRFREVASSSRSCVGLIGTRRIPGSTPRSQDCTPLRRGVSTPSEPAEARPSERPSTLRYTNRERQNIFRTPEDYRNPDRRVDQRRLIQLIQAYTIVTAMEGHTELSLPTLIVGTEAASPTTPPRSGILARRWEHKQPLLMLSQRTRGAARDKTMPCANALCGSSCDSGGSTSTSRCSRSENSKPYRSGHLLSCTCFAALSRRRPHTAQRWQPSVFWTTDRAGESARYHRATSEEPLAALGAPSGHLAAPSKSPATCTSMPGSLK